MDTVRRSARIGTFATLLCVIGVSGCAVLEFVGGLGDGGTDPMVPSPAPELDRQQPGDGPREVAGRVKRVLVGPEELNPVPNLDTTRTVRVTPDRPVEASAVVVDGRCMRMPVVGMEAGRDRRAFDWDSIRSLEPRVADSLAAAGALPRTDSLRPRRRVLGVDSMPTVRLDSADHPIRVAPLPRC